MTDEERALALRTVECLWRGVPHFEQVKGCLGFFGMVGAIVSLPVAMVACALASQFDLAHIIAGTLAIWSAVVVTGSALVIMGNHYTNRDLVIRAATGHRDIEHGKVVEYSGSVRSASLSSDVREPWIRELFIHFEDGDKVFVSCYDVGRLGLVTPPGEWAKLVRLPNSQIVLSFYGR